MRRFYTAVTTQAANGGYQVLLDGRGVKTPLGNPQAVPTENLAQALAQEWADQSEEIDPALFALRDLADVAIDMIAPDPATHIHTLLGFLETDTLCYRADPDEPSYKRQYELWEPILAGFEQREGVRMERICGVIHRPQPAATLAAIRTRLERLDPFTLTALLTLTSLSASLVIGLSTLEDGSDPHALWAAANLEEDWQIEQWGQDPEAAAVRVRRTADFANALRFAELVR